MERKSTKRVKIGDLYIGKEEKIAVQSMSTYRLCDVDNAVRQANEVKKAGCDIFRFSVLDEQDARSIKEVKKRTDIPLVADIHFDYRLAIQSIENGADKIRINPGNIGSEQNVKAVADALKERNIPVRVGSNTGSIDKEYLEKYGKNEISLGESALKNVRILEKNGIDNIVISVKASDVDLMYRAYKYVSDKTDYPLHLGVTEAGTEYNGIINNSMGIGALLLSGIGDTIRVSLSADPVKEVQAGKAILAGLGLKKDVVKVIACPTCGRCMWNCMSFASEVQEYVKDINKPLTVAVMGCAVNGPGEAKDADIGIAGGKDGCVIFNKGEVVRKVAKEQVREEFFKEIDKCLQ